MELWRAIQRQDTPEWESGKAFEYLTLRAFQLEGADVVYPYSVQFGGEEAEQIDGFIHTDGLSCLVECKDQQGNVNIEPIAKMRNQLMRRHVSTIGVPYQLLLAVPEIETVFFQNRGLLEELLDRQFTDLEWHLAQQQPRLLLNSLPGGSSGFVLQALAKLNDKQREMLRQYPLIQSLSQFLLSQLDSANSLAS